ncbi:relaxase/mobilization nuclease domain-containing protein [Methylovorus mays]|uniref:relaxase/mobilization nuclease domain-containing protein n=1 Tax=Methylovorus mays TaxID=184077 RepID=UPI001E557234|nr:relaxase/mobilization nuclease domain-containing protein [Methylovorus mays]MCB5206719.1 relaxase/mobilization nuclease domain-containing protein [Methylovorus mays]
MASIDHPVVIDGVLKEIGDRLFYETVRPIKQMPRRTMTGVFRLPKHQPAKRDVHYIQRKLVFTVRRAVEVMVKISGGPKGMAHIKAHLEYISRNGQLTLESEDGAIWTGKDELKDLQDQWRYGGYPIVEDTSKQAYSVILSMPPGTDRAAVTLAAREFAHQEFRLNYSYVFATHDDEKHPHVHLCVKAMGKDGVRLNPRKADLQRWREIFADRLRANGIEANATRRPVRGVTKRSRKQAVVHLEKRGFKSHYREALTQAATAFIRNGSPITNPLRPQILRTRQFVVASWNAIGHALQGQGEGQLSKEVKAFVEALPPVESVGERLEQQLRAQINNKQKDKGVDR